MVFHWSLSVTYWSSTEPSIKRCTCVNKQKNGEAGAFGRGCRNIPLTRGRGWIWCRCVRPTRGRCTSNNYITRCHRRLESVSSGKFNSSRSGRQLGTRCRIESQRQTEGLGLQWPTVEQPSQDEKEVLLYSEELWVNMLQSVYVSNSPLTHNQHQPFQIKCERNIFINKCVRSFIEVRHYVDYISVYSCICIMWLFNMSDRIIIIIIISSLCCIIWWWDHKSITNKYTNTGELFRFRCERVY